MAEPIVIGTRGSALALAQSRAVGAMIEAASGGEATCALEIISTKGDRVQDRPLAQVGGKGLFTLELEQALREGRIHIAVHSLKDLPTEDPGGIMLASVPSREDPADVLVGAALAALPEGAVVGTGSLRRRAFVVEARPDVEVRDIRGNVDTRLRKLAAGDYDAIVLAAAGLNRLGLDVERHPMSVDAFIPAPGQGALGIQCRVQDGRTQELLRQIDHARTRLCCVSERAFLRALGGGCNVPAAAHATIHRGEMTLRAALATATGVRRVELVGGAESCVEMGRQAAAKLQA